MERDCTGTAPDELALANDLAKLGAQALRLKYKREASSHAAMKRRCRDGAFELDPAWSDFRSFLRDMGPQPSKDATLDRMNGELLRYGPGLCRWATKTEQTINRRNTVWLDHRGERVRLQEFAEQLGAPYSTIHAALARGEGPEAIARRYSVQLNKHEVFRPAWIEAEEALQRFRVDYERWLRGLRRDRRSFAHPEVYAAILASEALYAARRKLSSIEIAPTEHDEAQARFGRELRICGNAVDWIKHALQSLGGRDPRLADRLLPRHGEWEELRKFEQWLLPPVREN